MQTLKGLNVAGLKRGFLFSFFFPNKNEGQMETGIFTFRAVQGLSMEVQ